jgi:hypothetical protein
MSEPAPSTGTSSGHTTADFIYDAFFSAGLGGSVVAIFFLIVDVARGDPLLTPTVIGAALFQGISPAEVAGVDLGLVTVYSFVHFAVFGLLGAAFSVLVHEAELHAKHPAVLLFTIFAVVEVGGIGAGTVFAPAVMAWIGYVEIAAANFLAAFAMAAFMVSSHRPELWREWKDSARLLAVGPGDDQ